MVGQFALSLVIAQPIFVFTSFNLGGVLMTDTRREFGFIDYYNIRMFMSGLGMLALVLICLFGHFDTTTRWVILLNGIGICLDSFSQLIYGLLALHSRMDRIAVSLALKGLLSLAGVMVGLLAAHHIVWAAAGSALASAMVVFGYDVTSAVQILRSSRPHPAPSTGGEATCDRSRDLWAKAMLRTTWNRDAMIRLAILASPMGITVTLISLASSIPRLFLEQRFGAGHLGLYAAQASFVTIGRMASGALDQASRPQLARHYGASERSAFVRLLNRLLLAGILMSLVTLAGAALFGRPLLGLLFTRQYANNLDVLLITLAASGLNFLGSTYLNALSAARQFRVQALVMLFVVAVTIVASAVLIPVLGQSGAALASLVATSAQVAVGAFIVHKIVAALPLKPSSGFPPLRQIF